MSLSLSNLRVNRVNRVNMVTNLAVNPRHSFEVMKNELNENVINEGQSNMAGDTFDKFASLKNKSCISYGIACFRIIDDNIQLLMIKKRCTYEFIEFSKGKYPIGDIRKNKDIKKILHDKFSKMTIEEKLDIYNLDHSRIWWRSHFNFTDTKQYGYSRNKFNEMFVKKDNGIFLRKMLNKSNNVRQIWELPKGRKNKKSEEDIFCATREFCEETNVARNAYSLIPEPVIKYSYIDGGITYHNKLYLAIANSVFEPKINLEDKFQVIELTDIKWVSEQEAYYLCENNKTLIKPIMNAFRFIKKYYSDNSVRG